VALAIKIRGIRSPIPSGHFIGRLSPGQGDAELITIMQVAATLVGSGAVPAPGAGSGINQLTGDVTAGPGTGTQVATLSLTGVMAGTYYNSTITVDAKGRLSFAKTGGMLPLVTGDTTPGNGPFAIADNLGQYIGVPL